MESSQPLAPIAAATDKGTRPSLQLGHLGLNVIGREILTNKDKLARKESLDAVLAQLLRLEPSLSSD